MNRSNNRTNEFPRLRPGGYNCKCALVPVYIGRATAKYYLLEPNRLVIWTHKHMLEKTKEEWRN